MIVSYKRQFAFFKTLKTASTSVEIFLSQFCGPQDIITYLPPPDEAIRGRLGFPGPQNCLNPKVTRIAMRLRGQSRHDARYKFHHNMPAAELRKLVDDDAWKKLRKFTIVRNPFDRAISKFFNDHKQLGIRYQHAGLQFSAEEISGYILSLPERDLTNWHIFSDGEGIIVDDVLRYENLISELSNLVVSLSLDVPVALPHAKGNWRTDRRHYSRILSRVARERIESVASREIEAFGYQWEERGG